MSDWKVWRAEEKDGLLLTMTLQEELDMRFIVYWKVQ